MNYTFEPLVSVGIPTYNRPQNLKRIVRSILSQTYTKIEIIISDNSSDCSEEVVKIINELQARDSRIRFNQHTENIGAMLNFNYLVSVASGEYFMWAPDDDDFEEDFIEKHVREFEKNSLAVAVVAGYDVVDTISQPEIKTDFTKYLQDIPAPTVYKRMLNFVKQPEYKGKIRIAWGGLYKTQVVKKAFEVCLEQRVLSGVPKSFETPIDLRMLSMGELVVIPELLGHVYLGPTSNGKSEVSIQIKSLYKENAIGFLAYRKAVYDAPLTKFEKQKLSFFLYVQEVKALARIIPYYILVSLNSDLARNIKVIWFGLLKSK